MRSFTPYGHGEHNYQRKHDSTCSESYHSPVEIDAPSYLDASDLTDWHRRRRQHRGDYGEERTDNDCDRRTDQGRPRDRNWSGADRSGDFK
jgi:hypothetical protein